MPFDFSIKTINCLNEDTLVNQKHTPLASQVLVAAVVLLEVVVAVAVAVVPRLAVVAEKENVLYMTPTDDM